MKTTVLSAVFLAAAASTASAQMIFETGNVDIDYYAYDGASGVATYGLGVRGGYSVGQLGLQLDGSVLSFRLGGSSLEGYSAGAHLNKQLSNGSKFGAYAAVDSFTLFGTTLYTLGAEAMTSFGAIEVEAAIGGSFTSTSSTMVWVADIDAYYQISPSLELNIGTMQVAAGNTYVGVYNVGIDYTLANVPLTIGASYLSRNGSGVYNLNASFAFGPKPEERLFSSRQYPLYIGF